jgi:hypothetical protein
MRPWEGGGKGVGGGGGARDGGVAPRVQDTAAAAGRALTTAPTPARGSPHLGRAPALFAGLRTGRRLARRRVPGAPRPGGVHPVAAPGRAAAARRPHRAGARGERRAARGRPRERVDAGTRGVRRRQQRHQPRRRAAPAAGGRRARAGGGAGRGPRPPLRGPPRRSGLSASSKSCQCAFERRRCGGTAGRPRSGVAKGEKGAIDGALEAESGCRLSQTPGPGVDGSAAPVRARSTPATRDRRLRRQGGRPNDAPPPNRKRVVYTSKAGVCPRYRVGGRRPRRGAGRGVAVAGGGAFAARRAPRRPGEAGGGGGSARLARVGLDCAFVRGAVWQVWRDEVRRPMW